MFLHEHNIVNIVYSVLGKEGLLKSTIKELEKYY